MIETGKHGEREWRGWARPDNGLQMTPYSRSLLHKVFTIIYVTNAPAKIQTQSEQTYNVLSKMKQALMLSSNILIVSRMFFEGPETDLFRPEAWDLTEASTVPEPVWPARPFTASLACWYPRSLNCFGFVRVLTYATIGVENLGAVAACGFSKLYVLSM